MTKKKKIYLGAIGFTNRIKTMRESKEQNKCPYGCIWGETAACARWGSGTPLLHFTRECTFKDLEECPLTEYPNEPNIVFWTKWLLDKGILRKVEK